MTTQNAAERPAGGQWAYPVRAVEWGTFWRLLDAEDGWVCDAPNRAMAEAVAERLNADARGRSGTLHIHGGAGGSMQIEFNGESVQAIAADRDQWRERCEQAEAACDELRQTLAAHLVATGGMLGLFQVRQWGRELWLACWMVAVGERMQWVLDGLAILQRGESC